MIKKSQDILSGEDPFAFDELVARYLDDELTDEQRTALNTELRADDARRDSFVEMCLQARLMGSRLAAQLQTLPQVMDTSDSPIATIATVAGSRGSVWKYAAVAALLVMTALLAFYFGQMGSQNSHAQYARVTAMIDAVGIEKILDKPLAFGHEYQLKSGIVELGYDSGARITLKGPARFSVESPGKIRLHKGRLAAGVPNSAQGLTIQTPAAQLVDFDAARFGVEVDSQTTETHVFVGQLLIKPVNARQGHWRDRSLKQDEALQLIHQLEDVSSIELAANRFVSASRDRLQWNTTIEDHFDGPRLNPANWRNPGENSGALVKVDRGRVGIANGGYLTTVRHLDPVQLNGLRIKGVWAVASHPTEDQNSNILRILTRSLPFATAGNSAIEIRMNTSYTRPSISVIGTSFRLIEAASSGSLTITNNRSYQFDLIDDGIGITFEISEVGKPLNTAKVSARLAEDSSDSNLVTIQTTSKFPSPTKTTFLDELTIQTGLLASQ